mgnify:CR=1 FL=1
MSLFYRNSIFWMLVFLIGLILITWLFSAVLTPFVCSIILAYLLAPLVNRLERFGLSRSFSGVLILIVTIAIIVGSLLFILPIFVGQLKTLISSLPEIYNRCLIVLNNVLPEVFGNNFLIDNEVLEMSNLLKNQGIQIASEVASYAFALFDFIILILIVPLITFYLLIDWNKGLGMLGRYLPKGSSKEIHDILFSIDDILSGFVRGQLLICACLGLFYSVSLSILGLDYGLLIGVFSGLISFIPFLGSVAGALIAVGVALYQFWDTSLFIFFIGSIFLVGQLLESNLLTPKLIGNAVRLHPITIMLSVSIGGALAGINGIMIAVPVAGTFGVLLRKLGGQYLASTFYRDSN